MSLKAVLPQVLRTKASEFLTCSEKKDRKSAFYDACNIISACLNLQKTLFERKCRRGSKKGNAQVRKILRMRVKVHPHVLKMNLA